MEFELYEQGKALLKSDDNLEWIEKITCWVKRESEYNIYIFQVIIENEEEINKYYEAITASIATEFQADLKKAIERWNIYLIFECKDIINWQTRIKIEQDKYAVRKLVWDNLREEEINDKEYIRKRLLGVDIKANIEPPKEKRNLIKIIEERDAELYSLLQKKNLTVEEKAVMYIGDGADE